MRERLKKVFGCDLRSLAVFRVALAMLILYDVGDRFPHAEAFYSDSGFFSTEYAKEESPYSFSVNYLSGAVEYQQAVFIALGLSALALAAGFFTRIATLICWILLISIHVRNPFVLIGGDTLLRMLLFWSLFVPLGKVWSVDRWLVKRRSNSKGQSSQNQLSLLATAGTACLILQVCIMYWCAGVAKMTEPWLAGTAMDYVLRLDLYVRPFGEWALTQPWLLKSITYGTLVVELAFPFLLFIPFWTDRFRLLTISSFIALHVGIDLSLNVGNFSMVSMVSWIPLIPGCIWNAVCCGKLKGKCDEQALVEIGQKKTETSATKATAPREFTPSTPGRGGIKCWICCCQSIVPLFFLAYIFAWNYSGLYVLLGTKWQLEFPERLQRVAWVTMVAQNFQMFGDPPRYNPTYVFSGRKSDATEIDLIRNQPARLSRPDQSQRNRVTDEWRKLHRFLLRHPGNQKFHRALLEYYTNEWNRDHAEDDQVVESRLECYYEQVGPEYQAGDFVRRPDLATWAKPVSEKKPLDEKTDEDLINDVDSFLKGLEQGPIIPMENR